MLSSIYTSTYILFFFFDVFVSNSTEITILQSWILPTAQITHSVIFLSGSPTTFHHIELFSMLFNYDTSQKQYPPLTTGSNLTCASRAVMRMTQ